MTARSTGRAWVVIPAAGHGSRFGSEVPKQYCRIGGLTVLERTLRLFADVPGLQGIVLALAPDDSYWAALDFPGKDRLRIADGGAERVHSVSNALRELSGLAQPDDFVLVHDAARPCLSQECLARLLDELVDHAVGGLLAIPVADTLKEANAAQEVLATRDRRGLWQAQTPQMFRYRELSAALAQALAADATGATVTDESSAIEAAGYTPKLVMGEAANLKITHQRDLQLAARILGIEDHA